jgi:hypothetical protein
MEPVDRVLLGNITRGGGENRSYGNQRVWDSSNIVRKPAKSGFLFLCTLIHGPFLALLLCAVIARYMYNILHSATLGVGTRGRPLE